jgi:hypothetical protein
MPINKEKAMTDAVDAICRLDFNQLILLNAQLSEHMHNILQHTRLRRQNDEEKKEPTMGSH